MKKIIIIICTMLVVFGAFIVKGDLEEKWLPSEQQGTYWSTEDGSVFFFVPMNKDDPIIGTMIMSGKETVIQIYMGGLMRRVDVTYKIYSDGEVVYPDEFWHPKKIQKNKFIVTVEGSDYFEEGEELVFYKVE